MRRLTGLSWLLAISAIFVALPGVAVADADADRPVTTSTESPAVAAFEKPLLAYYYIWYNPSSWRRGKTDLPLLGPYTSDERAIMRQHIAMAQSAGIDAFLVSWKDTSILTPRLERLVQVAREMRFRLGIVYQGLDFERFPLRVEKVQHDMELLADRYATDPVFDIFGRPLVIWSGLDEYDRSAVSTVADALDGRLLLLASAGSVDEYERVADLVGGNAHRWAAVDPTKSWYPDRMHQLGTAVQGHGGLWVAPAAPGFDARLVGGSVVVERAGTSTLATELSAAAASGADAIGLISWNEFSENTQVEPSQNYGTASLDEVARFAGRDPERVLGVAPSQAAGSPAGLVGWAALLLTALAVVIVSVVVRLRWPGQRRRHAQVDDVGVP